jgi:hypothetical protein
VPNANYQYITSPGTYMVASDWMLAPPSTMVLAYLDAGCTATFGLQWTLDDLQSNANPRWFTEPGIPAGTTATSATVINHPMTWLALVVTAISGGTLELKVLESVAVP